MVQVYTEPLYRRHFSSILGVPVFFRIGLLCAAIAVSLVVAYATGGFWVKITPTLDQATVHYSGDSLIVVEVRCMAERCLWDQAFPFEPCKRLSWAPAGSNGRSRACMEHVPYYQHRVQQPGSLCNRPGKSDLATFSQPGKPALSCMVSGRCMSSLVKLHTWERRRRSKQVQTP